MAAIGPQLFVAYANLAIYAFCYHMQQPVLPARVESLVVGDSSDDWASLQSWFGIMQLAGVWTPVEHVGGFVLTDGLLNRATLSHAMRMDVQIATKAKQLDALLGQVTKQKAELQALKAVKKA